MELDTYSITVDGKIVFSGTYSELLQYKLHTLNTVYNFSIK